MERQTEVFRTDATRKPYTYQELRRLWQWEREELDLHFTGEQVKSGIPNLDFEVWLELWDEAQIEE